MNFVLWPRDSLNSLWRHPCVKNEVPQRDTAFRSVNTAVFRGVPYSVHTPRQKNQTRVIYVIFAMHQCRTTLRAFKLTRFYACSYLRNKKECCFYIIHNKLRATHFDLGYWLYENESHFVNDILSTHVESSDRAACSNQCLRSTVSENCTLHGAKAAAAQPV